MYFFFFIRFHGFYRRRIYLHVRPPMFLLYAHGVCRLVDIFGQLSKIENNGDKTGKNKKNNNYYNIPTVGNIIRSRAVCLRTSVHGGLIIRDGYMYITIYEKTGPAAAAL